MIECESFWRILQDGLIDEDPLTRKRALYVLKWLLNYLGAIKKFSTKFENSDLPLMFWSEEQNEKFWSIWKTIILLFETLEEKQVSHNNFDQNFYVKVMIRYLGLLNI